MRNTARRRANCLPTRRNCWRKSSAGKLLQPRGVYGFFPANRVGDDVELYTDESRAKVLTTFHFLRQQIEKGRRHAELVSGGFCCAESIQHSTFRHSTSTDYIGAFAVTSGHGLNELVEKFKADHDDYNAIMAEALADRLAEAFAEFLHKRVREEWGYGKAEKLTTEDLIGEKYRGIRPAAGYPACPDHTEKGILWRLLDVEKNAGIKLTESFAMWPGSSVSGLVFRAPGIKIFRRRQTRPRSVAGLSRPQRHDLAGSRALAGAVFEL